MTTQIPTTAPTRSRIGPETERRGHRGREQGRPRERGRLRARRQRQAFSFDGVDDQVRAAAAGLSVGSDERSLELWAKVETFATEPYSTFFAGYGTPGLFNGAYELGAMEGDDRRPYFSQWGDSVHGSAMTAGDWRHLIDTNVGDLVKLYENGALVASKRMPVETAGPAHSFSSAGSPTRCRATISASTGWSTK